MLLEEQGMLLLQRLQPGNLAHRARLRRGPTAPAQPAVPEILSPLRKHEGVNLQSGCDSLHL
jgi:hypothetical protein